MRVIDIARATAAHYGSPVRDIMSHRQADGITRQRHLVAWLARRLTDRSTTAIGRVLNRCHSVIVRAVGRIEAEMQLDAVLRADAEAIAHRLRTRLADDPPGRGADQLAVDAMVSTALQFADADQRRLADRLDLHQG